MTPDEQRTAIAKICGWTDIRRQRLYAGDQDLWGTKLIGGEKHRNRLPNYLGDLNAMHEAEKVLTATQLTVYRNTLAIMNGGICIDDGGSFVNLSFAVSATAAQRAEAFLRTLGLWKATPTQPQ
jgi:hypothetical protein